MRRLLVNASASADIRKASLWYEKQQEGLGQKFLDRVAETIDRIELNPDGYAKIINEGRRANLRQFPYSLWFEIKENVIVIACLHQRRDRVLARERIARVIPFPEP